MSTQPTFESLGLSSTALDAIRRKGFEEPTEIQARTIPALLGTENNFIAQAQTGTGKTAAFGLPLLDLLNARERHTGALVLVPTRELANQVAEEINSLKGRKLTGVVPIYGGQSIDMQFRRLKRNAHIVVGTPGRVIDHLKRKTLLLDNIKYIILDEADEMLNMGFIEDVEKIMAYAPPERRVLLFSATMPERIKKLAHEHMGEYQLIHIKKKQLTTTLTEQIYFEVRAGDKFEALCRIIDMEIDFYGLIFCRTKNDVDEVAGHLLDRGYDSEALHGDISQLQRERTLDKFRKQRINVLVATDVAARGIDINNLTHVINYALPQDPESYIHRIGRTGRAGKAGTAVTFITPSEYKRLMFIQRSTHSSIKKARIPEVNEIINAKKDRIQRDLSEIITEGIDQRYQDLAAHLLDDRDPHQTVAALMKYCFEEEFSPDSYNTISTPAKRQEQIPMNGKCRLAVGYGKRDHISPRKLSKLLSEKGDFPPHLIRDIQIMDTFSFVTVPFAIAESLLHLFKGKGKHPLISRVRKEKKRPPRSS